MNDLETRGAVILGGPLEGTPDVLLVMRADSADEAARHLQGDPWTALNLLVVEKVMPWTVRLVLCGVLASRDKPAETANEDRSFRNELLNPPRSPDRAESLRNNYLA